MSNKIEVVKTSDDYHFQIIKLYSVNTDSGDIQFYADKDEVVSKCPASEVSEGYGIVDPSLGFNPNEVGDWYNSIEEAEEDIFNMLSEFDAFMS